MLTVRAFSDKHTEGCGIVQKDTPSIVRKSYNYRGEPVHLAVDPVGGGALPKHRCVRCQRDLPQDQFGPVAPVKKVATRVTPHRYVQALHPHCFKCRRQSYGEHTEHKLYSPALDGFFGRLVSGAVSGARARGILFAITKDDALGMYLAQDGICALTGMLMDWESPGRRGRNGRNYKAPSIDRIDSAGNYVLGNVQIIMQVANIMKNDLPQDTFVALCRQIASHNAAV